MSRNWLRSLGVKQVRKAMWGWCLKGDERSAVLRNEPLNIDVEVNDCKPGFTAFNQMKETFGRYILRIPAAYNEQGINVVLCDTMRRFSMSWRIRSRIYSLDGYGCLLLMQPVERGTGCRQFTACITLPDQPAGR